MGIQFEQVQVRESEAKELEQLTERIPCDVQVSIMIDFVASSIFIFL